MDTINSDSNYNVDTEMSQRCQLTEHEFLQSDNKNDQNNKNLIKISKQVQQQETISNNFTFTKQNSKFFDLSNQKNSDNSQNKEEIENEDSNSQNQEKQEIQQIQGLSKKSSKNSIFEFSNNVNINTNMNSARNKKRFSIANSNSRFSPQNNQNNQKEAFLRRSTVKRGSDIYRNNSNMNNNQKRQSIAAFAQVNVARGKKSLINQQKNKQSSSFWQSLYAPIKMKIFARKMVNNLKSRMLKRLTVQEFQLINDKSSSYLPNNQQNKQTQIVSMAQSFPFAQTLQQMNSSLQFKNKTNKQNCFRYVFNLMQMFPVFLPNNIPRVVWDLGQFIAITFFLITVPLNIAIQPIQFPNYNSFITILCNFLVFLDILVQFNTAVIERGKMIKERMKIIKFYIQGHLIFDILNISGLVISHYSDKEQLKWAGLIIYYKYFQFNKVLKILEESLHLSIRQRNIIKLIQLLVFVVYITHIFACMWMYVAVNIPKYKNENWMIADNIQLYEWYYQYLYALYFSVTTMCTVGYGDLSPVNQLEIFLCTITMLISCGIFAYAVNSIGSIFQEMQIEQNNINKKLYAINNYMKRKNISFVLQCSIRQYLEYYWQQQNETNQDLEGMIVNQLSDQLKDQLQFEANKIILKDSSIFQGNFSKKFIHKCVHLIQEKTYQPEQVIQTDKSDCIYFIEQGQVEFYLEIVKKQHEIEYHSILTLNPGQSFGSYAFFTGQKQCYKIRSLQFSQVLIIDRQEFINLVSEFTDDYENYIYIKDLLTQNNEQKIIGQKCICCKQTNHDFLTCPLIHTTFDSYKTIKKHNLNDFNARVKYKRMRSKEYGRTFKNIEQKMQGIEQIYQKCEKYLLNQSWYPTSSSDDSFSQESSVTSSSGMDELVSQQYSSQEQIIEEEEFSSSQISSSQSSKEDKTITNKSNIKSSSKNQIPENVQLQLSKSQKRDMNSSFEKSIQKIQKQILKEQKLKKLQKLQQQQMFNFQQDDSTPQSDAYSKKKKQSSYKFIQSPSKIKSQNSIQSPSKRKYQLQQQLQLKQDLRKSKKNKSKQNFQSQESLDSVQYQQGSNRIIKQNSQQEQQQNDDDKTILSSNKSISTSQNIDDMDISKHVSVIIDKFTPNNQNQSKNNSIYNNNMLNVDQQNIKKQSFESDKNSINKQQNQQQKDVQLNQIQNQPQFQIQVQQPMDDSMNTIQKKQQYSNDPKLIKKLNLQICDQPNVSCNNTDNSVVNSNNNVSISISPAVSKRSVIKRESKKKLSNVSTSSIKRTSLDSQININNNSKIQKDNKLQQIKQLQLLQQQQQQSSSMSASAIQPIRRRASFIQQPMFVDKKNFGKKQQSPTKSHALLPLGITGMGVSKNNNHAKNSIKQIGKIGFEMSVSQMNKHKKNGNIVEIQQQKLQEYEKLIQNLINQQTNLKNQNMQLSQSINQNKNNANQNLQDFQNQNILQYLKEQSDLLQRQEFLEENNQQFFQIMDFDNLKNMKFYFVQHNYKEMISKYNINQQKFRKALKKNAKKNNNNNQQLSQSPYFQNPYTNNSNGNNQAIATVYKGNPNISQRGSNFSQQNNNSNMNSQSSGQKMKKTFILQEKSQFQTQNTGNMSSTLSDSKADNDKNQLKLKVQPINNNNYINKSSDNDSSSDNSNDIISKSNIENSDKK